MTELIGYYLTMIVKRRRRDEKERNISQHLREIIDTEKGNAPDLNVDGEDHVRTDEKVGPSRPQYTFG